MQKIIKNKVSLTLNPKKNERTLSSYQPVKKDITNSAYSLRTSNMINPHKETKININTNKYLICNTSPNTKITKNLNLTRTLQTITRSSHSKEGILSSKYIHKNNILSNINTNHNITKTSSNNNISSTNTNSNYRHTISMSNTNSNTSQRINYPLTQNAQRNKYQRVSIATNSNNTNNNSTAALSPSNKNNYCYANLSKVRISHKAYGIIQAYATITSSGKRNYNEDRVSIIYNIPKPQGYTQKNTPWPNCSFFGLYDGHGGSAACDFLRDNLHKYIINDKYFPSNPQKAIANGFISAEKLFFKNYTGIDPSGSCAIVVVIIENRVYIANVGDSRAILSAKNGTKVYPLSRDHRPGDEQEYKRILDAGGKIYKTEYEYGNKNSSTAYNNNNNNNNNRNIASTYNNNRNTTSTYYNSNNNRNSTSTYNSNYNNNRNSTSTYNSNNNNNRNSTSTYNNNDNNRAISSNYNNRSNTNNNKISNANANNYYKSPVNTKSSNNYTTSRYTNNSNKNTPNITSTNNRISSYISTPNNNNNKISAINTISINKNSVIGPLRVSPGKLSVSRTIGDIEAKDPKYGGNPNVIISIPEIKYFDNTDKNDFILIFCDGVYEKLKNKDILDCIWKEISKKKFPDIHHMSGYCIEKLINKCILSDCTDNLTCIMICLKNYDNLKLYMTPPPQTENIEQVKNKKLNITANIRQKSQSKKPLSMLLTKMIHNNLQNIKKVINLKNNDNSKDIKDKYKRSENK